MSRQILTIFIFCIFTIQGMSQNEPWRKLTNLPDNFPRLEQTQKSLFYLQRNMNVNTIVYDLNFHEDGSINIKEPIDVYWRRFPKDKAPYRKEITWLEHKFAFGYHSKKEKNGDGFQVELVAYGDRKIRLKKNKNGRYEAFMDIKGKNCQLTNLYVYADLTNWWPDVIHVDIYGKDPNTGAIIHERFLN